MFVQYRGENTARVLMVNGRPVEVKRLDVIEVPDDLGRQLCAQKRVWREAVPADEDDEDTESVSEAEAPTEPESLDSLTVPELRQLAEERGLEVSSSARRADLIAALTDEEAD